MRWLAIIRSVLPLVVTGLTAIAPVASGVAAEMDGPDLGVDASELNRRIADIESTTTVDDETAAELQSLYRRALANLEQAHVEETEAARLTEIVEKAPAELESLRRSLEALPQQDSGLPVDATMVDLQSLLTTEKARLAELETELSRLKERSATQSGGPAIARSRLLELRQQYESTLAALEVAPPADQLGAMTEARRWHLQSRAARLTAERRKLEQELLSHQARVTLLNAQQSLLAVQAEGAGTRVRQIEEAASRVLASEAELAQQEAAATRDELENRHPLIRDLALRGAELSDLLAARATELETASAARDSVRRINGRIEEELASTRNKLEIAGLSQAVGQLLIEQRRALPDLATLEGRINRREQKVAELGLTQINLVEERRALREPGILADEVAEGLLADEAQALRDELTVLASTQRELLQKVLDSGSVLITSLGDLDLAEQQLVEIVQIYDEFLARRLLWNRNSVPVKLNSFINLPDDIGRLLAPANWRQVVDDFTAGLSQEPMTGFVVLALLGLSLLRRRLLAVVGACAQNVGLIRSDRFTDSAKAFGATVLAAAPLPLLVILAGSIIDSSDERAQFSDAVASSMLMVGVDLLILQLFFDAFRVEGFAEKHCSWPAESATKMRFEFGWLKWLLPGFRFVGEASFLLDAGGFIGPLAAITNVGAAGALGVFLIRMFVPKGGVARNFLATESHSLLARLKPIWLGVLSAILPLLIILWLVGYNYGASALAVALMHSLWLILGLVLLQGLLVRWLVLGYRRLRLQAAVERREVARAEREAEKTAEEKIAGDEIIEVEEEEVDLAALGVDSRRLLNLVLLFAGFFGLWFIWSEIIPALAILDDITFWSRSEIVGGETALIPVTLSDVLTALLIGLATATAARGLPSFVEFLALQYTTMSTGSRYTAATLLRYGIYGLGIVSVFGILGGNWSQVQWLVAALGVGIGFGLQEIVANFISGLIILFERPIRVGDVVTVGESSGVVTRIKIRATTITDWDRKELLVPNKEFITNRLLNWTLSDTITRIVIEAGVAYGSDVFRAMKLMAEAAEEHPNVLDDPSPLITFNGFGDNALNLMMRAYLPSIDNRIGTISDIYTNLNRKFDEAGIVIAFPQRHLQFGDSGGPLEIRLQQPDERL